MHTRREYQLLAAILIIIRFVSGCLHDFRGMQSTLADDISSAIGRRSQVRNSTAKSKTALVNVRVFDGYKIWEPSTIVIDGDRISFDTTHVDSVIDGLGGVLIPGLIDSHCHPSSVAHLEALSSYGVTSALQMGCTNYTLCAALHDQPGLTSMLFASLPAVAPNTTHAELFQLSGNQLVSSPSQAQDFVTWAFNNGSDFFKIIAETNGPSQATQNALVAQVHSLGKHSMTHAATIEGYSQAIASNTDGIQHTPGDGNITVQMIQQMSRQRQYITPTMDLVKALEGTSITWYQIPGAWATVQANVKAMHRAGLPILAGTDALGSFPLLNISFPFGSSLHNELEYLVRNGFTPAEALRAATMLPAQLHRLHDRGVIAAGKRADLVLLGHNPLKNISNTRDIRRVWNGGIEYTNITTVRPVYK